jgi:hemerythrin superfamily protein
MPQNSQKREEVRMNALMLLKKDHTEVRNLFSQFERAGKTDHERRTDLFAEIRRELQIHSRAEEEIFYPAIKALDGEGERLVTEAIKEHRSIEGLLTQISRLKSSDRNFDEEIETLLDTVDSHIEEEEGEIFQFAQENCSEQQLEEIGQQLDERKRVLDRQLAA